MKKEKLLLIGNGKMGGSFIQQIHSLFETTVVDPLHKPSFDCNYFLNLEAINDSFDTVVFGVKPFDLKEVLNILDEKNLNKNCRFISLIAGAKTSIFKEKFKDVNVTLCMANLPVKVGKGVVAIYSDTKLEYLENLGQNIYISTEDDIGKSF
jgi:pyrroline-5-carboxylate reductase